MKIYVQTADMRDRIIAGSKIHHVAAMTEPVRVGDLVEFWMKARRRRRWLPDPPEVYVGKAPVSQVLPIAVELDAYTFRVDPGVGRNGIIDAKVAVCIAGGYIGTSQINNFAMNEGWRFKGPWKNIRPDLQGMLDHFQARGLAKGVPFRGNLVVWKRPIVF